VVSYLDSLEPWEFVGIVLGGEDVARSYLEHVTEDFFGSTRDGKPIVNVAKCCVLIGHPL
jgi:hypothetical protein